MLGLKGHFQNAYVVRDIDRACAMLRTRHAIGEFIRFDAQFEARGFWGRGPHRMKIALAWIDQLQIELIESVTDPGMLYGPQPVSEGLQFHHVGFRVTDWDRFRHAIDADGLPVAMEGAVDGCRFLYVDARDSLGHYLEYVWLTPAMWAANGGC